MLFVVDSRQRVNGTCEEYDYDLFSSYKHTLGLSLKESIIPKSMYPVIEGYNDTIESWTGESAFVLPPGNYTGDEVATLLSAHDSDITVAYNANTRKFEWTNAGGSDVDINGFAPAARLFGFDPFTLAFTALASATTSMPFIPQLSYPQHLRLNVEIQGDRGELCRDAGANFTFTVDLGVNFGEYASTSENDKYRQMNPVSDLTAQRLHIKFANPDSDAPLNFNGVDHVLVFEGH
jgi:hypothetical protein